MAYALRSPNGTGSGGNTNTGASGDIAVSKPSGVADGDQLVCVIYAEADTNTVDSTPSGWTLDGSATNTGDFTIRVYSKIAASEPASWTWSMTTGTSWYSYVIAAFTGASGSAPFLDVAGSASQADGATTSAQTASSITTTVNDSLVVFAYGNFSGSTVSALSGFATNLAVSFGGTTIAYANQATAGATGTTNPTGMGSENYAAIHISYRLVGSGGGGGARFILGTH